MGFTMAERKKIRAEYAKRYRKAKKAEKTKILNEYLELIGKGSRKYAIFILNREGKKQLRFIDGKNVNDVIRKTVEHFRYEGDDAFTALKKVYSYLNPLINCFYSAKKTVDKKTLPNGKVKKIFEKQLKTPYERLLEHPAVSQQDKKRAMKIKAALDIVALHEKL